MGTQTVVRTHTSPHAGRAVRPATVDPLPADGCAYVFSFDVEEHHRIEAAVGLECSPVTRAEYARRMDATTRHLLDRLDAVQALATFYIVGDITESNPALVREIAARGHEVGSHGWDHRRVHHFDRKTFEADVRRCKEALEQAAGIPVVGYRAPTFSVMRGTGWAVDALAAAGYRYDTSVFPVRHDRYGVPSAPRTPFVAVGQESELLELPPATWRLFGTNLPVAGGGYFRLFPPAVMRLGLRQLRLRTMPAVGMLYFHPWEFDPDQPRLPLGRLKRWWTYVGINQSLPRLDRLLRAYPSRRAIDVVNGLEPGRAELPRFALV